MKSKQVKITIIALILSVMTMAVFAIPDSYAATGTAQTKAPTKASKKSKVVAINIAIMSETDAEVDITIEKITKKKKYAFEKTVSLKKGGNYFTYNKGTKGRYEVSVNAYGDTDTQPLTAVQGSYTLLFRVSPPKDGDGKKENPIVYQDLTKIKDKK